MIQMGFHQSHPMCFTHLGELRCIISPAPHQVDVLGKPGTGSIRITHTFIWWQQASIISHLTENKHPIWISIMLWKEDMEKHLQLKSAGMDFHEQIYFGFADAVNKM